MTEALPPNVYRKGKGYRAIVQVDGQQMRSRTVSTPGAAAAEVDRLKRGQVTTEELLCQGVRSALAASSVDVAVATLRSAWSTYQVEVSKERRRRRSGVRPSFDLQLEVVREQVQQLLRTVLSVQQTAARPEAGADE